MNEETQCRDNWRRVAEDILAHRRRPKTETERQSLVIGLGGFKEYTWARQALAKLGVTE